jgi:hypothetical protein
MDRIQQVTCVAVDHALDICVSGSKDGTCIVHNLSDGVYVRSVDHPSELGINLVHLSSMGHIVMYSQVRPIRVRWRGDE